MDCAPVHCYISLAAKTMETLVTMSTGIKKPAKEAGFRLFQGA